MVKFIKFWGVPLNFQAGSCVWQGDVRGCVADVRGEGWVLETKSLWISAGYFLTSSEIWENKMILDFNFQKIHENTRNTTTYVWLCLVHLKVIPYFRLELVASGSGVWTPRTGRPLRSGNKRTGWTGQMAPAGRSPSAIGNNGIPVKNPPISLETFSQWLGWCLLMAMPYLGTNPL